MDVQYCHSYFCIRDLLVWSDTLDSNTVIEYVICVLIILLIPLLCQIATVILFLSLRTFKSMRKYSQSSSCGFHVISIPNAMNGVLRTDRSLQSLSIRNFLVICDWKIITKKHWFVKKILGWKIKFFNEKRITVNLTITSC